MRRKSEPLVGGESARVIADTIRALPIEVTTFGRVIVDTTSVIGPDAAFTRAYERIELAVMAEETHCSERGAHRTMDDIEFRQIVLADLMWRAKRALGETGRVDGLWMS